MESDRAPRYILDRVITYRGPRQEEWIVGKVENMSSSGLLLSGPAAFPVGSRLEVHISLRSQEQPQAGNIVGVACVVRQTGNASHFWLGAKFVECRLAARAETSDG